MITEKLKLQVKHEADLLKINATDDELQELDFESLNPLDATMCIYGQMTGDCFSHKSLQLIRHCAIPFSFDASQYITPTKDNFDSDTEDRDNVTAIEYYIPLQGAKLKELISYLKGESNTLEL